MLSRDQQKVNAERRARLRLCKRCHIVIDDCEPHSPHGDYFHPRHDPTRRGPPCPNAGKYLSTKDPTELIPFTRKGQRR